MFPIRDDNPTHHLPIATYAIIALNALAWFFVQGMGTDPALARSVCELGAIPGELLGRIPAGTHVKLGPQAVCIVQGSADWTTAVTSMFLHGSWFHIIGNMWFLAIFGDNVEDDLGIVRFVFFYLLCGLAAVAAQVASSPASAVPMVGASGAIGGVMGAYAVLHPRAQVHTLLILGFWIERIRVPAVVMLGYWFVLQLVGGIPSIGGEEGGVAFWAHVGGFACGGGLALVLRDPGRRRRR